MKGHSSTPRPHEIPEASLRRLPIYYRFLQQMAIDKVTRVSCADIARGLGLDPTQVRKDIEMTGIVGKPRVGYPLADLVHWIENFLGWNNTADGYLVGVGNLGSALLGYQGFKDYGLNIIAAFDVDERKIGTEIHETNVLHVSKLPSMIRRMGIKIGILTVPAQSAQFLADIMIKAGMRAIWNFSPVKLTAPPHVIIQHENLASSLAVLSKKLAQAIKAKA